MLSLSAKIRENKGKDSRKKGALPAVLYGPKIKPQSIEVDLSNFEKVYQEAGESSLINIKIENKEFPVLVHETQRDPISGKLIHIDFYQPILTEKVEVAIPIVFEGEALAVRDLGGTLIKEIKEIEVRALPQDLPHEIKVNVEKLKTFEDEILVKDLDIPDRVEILKEPDEVVANVLEPTKIEEELEKPIAAPEGEPRQKRGEEAEKTEEEKAGEEKEEKEKAKEEVKEKKE